jgi:hypothetical protein
MYQSQGSEQSCIFVLGVSILPLYNFSINLCSCFDSDIFSTTVVSQIPISGIDATVSNKVCR